MKLVLPRKWKRIAKRVIVLFILYKGLMHVSNRRNIKGTLMNKADIEIPYTFYILENEVYHTPNAFDSDYTWDFEIRLSESNMKDVINQIENSKQNSRQWNKENHDSLRNSDFKGFWHKKGDTFWFNESDNRQSHEYTSITIDPKQRTIRVGLVHL